MIRPNSNHRAPRIDVRRPAVLINSDGVEISVIVLDISKGGFRVEIREELHIGERVTFVAEHDRLPAEIRWVLGNEAGGAFLAPADQTALGDFNRR